MKRCPTEAIKDKNNQEAMKAIEAWHGMHELMLHAPTRSMFNLGPLRTRKGDLEENPAGNTIMVSSMSWPRKAEVPLQTTHLKSFEPCK